MLKSFLYACISITLAGIVYKISNFLIKKEDPSSPPSLRVILLQLSITITGLLLVTESLAFKNTSIPLSISFIFFTCVIGIASCTDIATMSIFSLTSIYPIPLWLIASWQGYSAAPSFFSSILGLIFGYGILFFVNIFYQQWRGIPGIGNGDFDLCASIASYTGIEALSTILLLSSFFGIGASLLSTREENKCFSSSKIPFASCLFLGTSLYLSGKILNLL